MKRKTQKPKSIRDNYPNHPASHGVPTIRRRGGCKVYWDIVATEEQAKKVREWALVEAEIKEQQGYDSGYCSPGSIEKVKDGFEVCIL